MFISNLDHSGVCIPMHLLRSINGNLLNLIGFKTLNIHYSKTTEPIDFPFTGGVQWVIRGYRLNI